MLKFLNKKYPFNDDLKYNAKLVFFISIGVLGFIFLFQPIDREEFTKLEMLYLAIGLAASTFLVLTVNLMVLPSLLPKLFNRDRWSIKREIIWNFWSLITISFFYYLFYTKLFGIIFISFISIWKIGLLALVPIALLIVINYHRLLRANLKTSKRLNEKLIERKDQLDRLIQLNSDYKKDSLLVKANAIVLIKAADNYIEVFYQSDGKVIKQMIRNSMKNVEIALKEFSFIIKCHRSFIVNINHIINVQGNSQGYKLFFENISFPAFVSQLYIGDFKKRFNI